MANVDIRYRFSFSPQVHTHKRVPEGWNVRGFTSILQQKWGCSIRKITDATGAPIDFNDTVGDHADQVWTFSISSFVVTVLPHGCGGPQVNFRLDKTLFESIAHVPPLWKDVVWAKKKPHTIFCVTGQEPKVLNQHRTIAELLQDGCLQIGRPIRIYGDFQQPKDLVTVHVVDGTSPNNRSVDIRLDKNNPIRVSDVLEQLAQLWPMSWIREKGVLRLDGAPVKGPKFVLRRAKCQLALLNKDLEKIYVQYLAGPGCPQGDKIVLNIAGSDPVTKIIELYDRNTPNKKFSLNGVHIYSGVTDEFIDSKLTVREAVKSSSNHLVLRVERWVYHKLEVYSPDNDELFSDDVKHRDGSLLMEIAEEQRAKLNLPGSWVPHFQHRRPGSNPVDCQGHTSLRGCGFEDDDVLVILFDDAQPRCTIAPAEIESFDIAPFKLDVSGWSQIRKLGRGTFASVFEYERPDGSRVAVKEFEAEFCESEVRFLLALRDHPSIVTTYGWADMGDTKAIVMEIVPYTLSSVIEKDVSPTDLYRLLLGVAGAIQFIHASNVVHRDLKPQNFLVDKDYEARLSDFGCAKQTSTSYSLMNTVTGTIAYMAPEIMEEKDYSAKADVFSFGCILYAMLTRGSLLWRARTQWGYSRAIIAGHRPEVPPLVSDHPLGELLKKCWNGDPDIRPSSDEVFAMLRSEEYFLPGADHAELRKYIATL